VSAIAALPATAHARRHLCRGSIGPIFSSSSPEEVTTPLDPAVTSMFAVLRRPAGAQDQVPLFNPLSEDLGFHLRSYFPAYIRQVAVDPDGERYLLIAGFERILALRPARCVPRRVRRRVAQIEAQRRARERQPVYCIEDVGPHRPRYSEASCQPFATVESGAGLIATAQSSSDVIELAPDGVVAVRLLYRGGRVITAPVSNNAFKFTPPQRPIKQARVRFRRLASELENRSRHHHLPSTRLFLKILSETFGQLAPQSVEWIGASGKTLRSFRPSSERNFLSIV
jgi:hypothetical protein